MKKTIIIGIAIILLAVIGFFTYYMLNSNTVFVVGDGSKDKEVTYVEESQQATSEDDTPIASNPVEQEIDIAPSNNLTQAKIDKEKRNKKIEKSIAEFEETDGDKAIDQLTYSLTNRLYLRNQDWALNSEGPNNLKNIVTDNFLSKFNEDDGILYDLDWEEINYASFDVHLGELTVEYTKEDKTYKAYYDVDLILKDKRHYINDISFKGGYCMSNPLEIPFNGSKLFDILILAYGGRNRNELIKKAHPEGGSITFIPTEEFINNYPDTKILGELPSDIYDIDWFDNDGFIYTNKEGYIKIKILKDGEFYWNYYTISWVLDSKNQITKVDYKLEKTLKGEKIETIS